MDINVAQQTLENLVVAKSLELESLKMSLGILNKTFEPQFMQVEQAKKEVADLTAQLQAKVADVAVVTP